jgi:HK97 family phage major capsid protein
MKQLSPSAMLEIRRLKGDIDTLLAKPNITRADGKRIDAMLGQISAIKEAGITDLDAVRARVDEIGATISAEERAVVEAHEAAFRAFMTGRSDEAIQHEIEKRGNLLAGSQTISFTAGPQGGVTVPMSFQKAVTLGLSQTDPLLDPDVADVIQESTLALPPKQYPGWDLSTIAATKVTEAVQHAADAVPASNQKLVNSFSYRLSIGASYEFEQDVFDSAMERLGEAFGVGFARGIGVDLITGAGSGVAPQGVLVGAANSGITTANAGALVLDDFTNIYFAVNRIYRAKPKCAWLLSDPIYKLARQAVDNSGRPLLSLVDDKETILGKPVYICPSLETSPSVGGDKIVFGDLGHFHVHLSSMYIRRSLQLPGYIENGLALYNGYMRADAVVDDPTSGAMPPIVYATTHA